MDALRAIFACVALLAIATLIEGGWRDPTPPAPARAGQTFAAVAVDSQARLAERLRDAPEYAAFFLDFAHAFPADFDMLARRFARAPADSSPFAPDAAMMEALEELRRSHGLSEAKASGASLDRVFAAQRELAHALAKADPTLCAQFLYGRTNKSFLAFARSNRRLVAAMGEASVAAAVDGSAAPVDRPAPTEADFDHLAADLRSRGLDQEDVDVLLNGRTPAAPLSDSRLCAVGLLYLDALRALPAETRARIYGFALLSMAQI